MQRKCPICDENDKEELFSISFLEELCGGLPQKNKIVVCENCGFAFADNNANQEMYDKYYSACNVYAYDNAVKSSELDEPEIIPIIERYIDKDKKIVDVGFGDGSLLAALKKRGYSQLIGVDPDEESCAQLREKDIEAIKASVFDFNNQTTGYDVVISTCVAEHIYDLKGYFFALSELINEKGIIVIQVPAVEGFEKKYTRLPNYFNVEHINYFSVISLDNALSKYGFKRVNEDVYFWNRLNEYMLVGVYERGDCKFMHDDISRDSILHYYSEYERKSAVEMEMIKKFADKHDEIIIWGCGQFASQLLSNNSAIKSKIVYAVDSSKKKQDKLFCGKRVYSKEELKNRPYPILVCSMQNGGNIEKEIKKMNIGVDYLII